MMVTTPADPNDFKVSKFTVTTVYPQEVFDRLHEALEALDQACSEVEDMFRMYTGTSSCEYSTEAAGGIMEEKFQDHTKQVMEQEDVSLAQRLWSNIIKDEFSHLFGCSVYVFLKEHGCSETDELYRGCNSLIFDAVHCVREQLIAEKMGLA